MASNRCPSLEVSGIVNLQVRPWTTARLDPEALEHNFHALEDEDMIKWLGRATFVDTCINGTLGWQEKIRIFFFLFHFFFKSGFLTNGYRERFYG